MNASKRTRSLDQSREQSERKNGRGSAVKEGTDRARDMLAEHPKTSALSGFLLGFGAGLLLTGRFGASSRRQESIASRWGHKMHDAVSGVLPQSWSR